MLRYRFVVIAKVNGARPKVEPVMQAGAKRQAGRQAGRQASRTSETKEAPKKLHEFDIHVCPWEVK